MIGLAPLFVRWASQDGMGPTGIGFWRTFLGFLVLFAWNRSLRAHPLHLLAGLFFAADLYCWHRSVIGIGAGPATLLANTQVFWMGLIGILVLGEPGGKRFWISLGMGVAGIWLLSGGLDPSRMDRIGLAYGLVTGAFYSAFLLTLRRAGGGPAGMALSSLSGALALGAVSFHEGDLGLPSFAAFLKLAALALLVQVLAWIVISENLPKVPASRVGLLLLPQILLATMLGWLLFGETLTALQTVGAGVTLAGVYLGALSRTKGTASA